MNDLQPVFSILVPDDVQAVSALRAELADAWAKRQVFRTETEMRVSVLNDIKHPTHAAKYWQCVREQTSMLDELTLLSFQMRRTALARRRAEIRLATAEGDLEREEAQIELDELLFRQASAEQVAHDRVREIIEWSRLKAEFDDGSFDTSDPNGHQLESYALRFERQSENAAGAALADKNNLLGQLVTARRHIAAKQLKGEHHAQISTA